MANPGLSEIAATTTRLRSKKMANYAEKNNAILMMMKEKGGLREAPGGRTIVEPTDYKENDTVGWYSGTDTLNTSSQDVITAFEYNWKQLAGAVSVTGLEAEVQNVGKEQFIDLVKGRFVNLERSLNNKLAEGLHSDGTADGSKEVGGLDLLVSQSPTTGSVGGVDRSTTAGAFARNQLYEGVSDGGAAVSSSNVIRYLNRLYRSTGRGRDVATLHLADDNYYGFYEEAMQGRQRVQSSKLADAGFDAMKYKGGDAVYDGGQGGFNASNTWRMLNLNYLFYRPAKNRNFVPMKKRASLNQDVEISFIVWAGNLTCSNFALQGCLKA